ncbi:MAG: hypothetical protein JXQ90_17200 [Cyclobacteriaceae bacterium]
MVASLSKMPDHARLWVYQANRQLINDELEVVASALEEFLKQWAAHGQELKAGYEVLYDQMIVMAVDESFAGASGCSIDSSVSVLRALGEELGVSFLDRSQIAFLKGDQIEMHALSSLKAEVESGNITTDMKIFNNAVTTLGDWKNAWLQSAGDSWMKRYFAKIEQV